MGEPEEPNAAKGKTMKYEKGRRYRVVRPGARLNGMKPKEVNFSEPGVCPQVYSSWNMPLEVGDVITCAGTSMTMGDGLLALKWQDAEGNHLAHDCTFRPSRRGFPDPGTPEDGYLVSADDQTQPCTTPKRAAIGEPPRRTTMTARTHNAMTTRQISEVLSPRATKVLHQLGVQTVQQLKELNPARIPPVLGAGPKTTCEIVALQERLFGIYEHPVRQEIEEVNPDARILDGLEDALVGYTEAGRMDEDESPLAVYDREKCVSLIMERGRIREDAEAHLQRNIIQRLGENAPVFIVRKEGERALDDIALLNPKARLADGLEDALVGHTDPRQDPRPVAVYDSERCVRIIMEQIRDEDESEEDARENAEDHLSYNFHRALPYYGEDAPIFVKAPD